MALGNQAILDAMEFGWIVIDPFNPSQLNNASYDVRLGEFLQIPQPEQLVNTTTSDSHRVFKCTSLDLDGPYSLDSGGKVLAHTEEFIGGTRWGPSNGILGVMKTKSTAARWGLDVCMAAGWGDVGYINRWTMEIYNSSPFPILLEQGMLLAQIVFEEINGVDVSYEQGGNYQNTHDLEKLKKHWTPNDMLPKPIKVVHGT